MRFLSYFALSFSVLISDSNADSTFHEKRRQLQFDEPSCREIDQNQIYKCPVRRYCPWDSFTESSRQFLRSQLSYTRRKWNYNDRINEEIENVKFEDLNVTNQDALIFLGFDQSSHDCCHGHYITYEWNDFTGVLAEVKSALELIGYNETNWERRGEEGFPARYDGILWDDLPQNVRIAAQNNLCFNKELWDKIDISLWNNQTVIPGSINIEDDISQTPTEAPVSQPLAETSPPTQQIKLDTSIPSTIGTFAPTSATVAPSLPVSEVRDSNSTPSILPSSMLITSNPSESTTMSPSVSMSLLPSVVRTPDPTSEPTIEVTPPPTIKVTPYPTFADGILDACHRLNPKMEYFCPIKRYCEWNYYDFANRQYLRFQLGYDRSSWNYYSMMPYESTAFTFLPSTVQNGLTAFAGYDEDSYDCCQGHYNDYDWSDFEEEGFEEVKQSLIDLGYNQVKWDGGASIPYDEYEWSELPPNIQKSVEALCYTKETWDKIPLDLWPQQAKLPGEYERIEEEPITISPTIQPPMVNFPSSAPCRKLDPDEEYWCPVQRYCEWDQFEFRDRQVLTFQIGYTESEWNYDKTNILELQTFNELNEYAQRGLVSLGYNEDKHDCCLNHYSGYSWDELSTLDGMGEVKAAFEMIGYDEKKWNDGEASDFDDYDWDELPNEIRAAMYSSLCYNRELWDQVPLTVWPEDVVLPTSSQNPFLGEVSAARPSSVWKSFTLFGLSAIIISTIFNM